VQQSFLFYTLGTRPIPAAFAVHMHTHADKDAIARMHTHKCTHTHSKSHKYTHIRACTHKTHTYTHKYKHRPYRYAYMHTHTHPPPLPTHQPFHTCGHVGWLDTATPLRVKLAIAQSMLSRIFCKGHQQKETEQLHVLQSYESTTGWLGTAIGLPVMCEPGEEQKAWRHGVNDAHKRAYKHAYTKRTLSSQARVH
jgi:hypothetical protein